MTIIHNLGFPRIGLNRELKKSLEIFWRGECNIAALLQTGSSLRQQQWSTQASKGVDFITVGDFSYYDHVLDMSVTLGCIPRRFRHITDDFDRYFCMARGYSPTGDSAHACEMTKWFDTNYHYLVPEFEPSQQFQLSPERLLSEIREAQALNYRVKPVIIGPLTYLWLGKTHGDTFNKLDLLETLLPEYAKLLSLCKQLNIQWLQIDEPILTLDLPQAWQNAFEWVYQRIHTPGLNILLTSYFGALKDNLTLACRLPVAGLHIDAVRAPEEAEQIIQWLPKYKILSVGIINGRNVWRADLADLLATVSALKTRLNERLWLAPSCSLLHVPLDLNMETSLDSEIKSWLAFAVQKLDELSVLRNGVDNGHEYIKPAITQSGLARISRKKSPRVHRAEVTQKLSEVDVTMLTRSSPYLVRRAKQRNHIPLPVYPTTTIGSFPQTAHLRQLRSDRKQGLIGETEYQQGICAEITATIRAQEEIGLDVLVHGESERNDMVEYFGELLEGFTFTSSGWVQSYGSRCVKPPIIYGDVLRRSPMTLTWIRYAQSLTDKPLKGMLTGPVTMINWSFVRDDQPRETTCLQIALALRDEVQELEQAGIRIIQIDEAALREGLPLRLAEQKSYLNWAIKAFRLVTSGVRDETQIHTHMCYSQFNEILDAIAELDADVTTIETSRSHAGLLKTLCDSSYPNEIGPGVYDIHSPNTPTIAAIASHINQLSAYFPVEKLWINPDCGLKTRRWEEVMPALQNMVAAAKLLRGNL